MGLSKLNRNIALGSLFLISFVSYLTNFTILLSILVVLGITNLESPILLFFNLILLVGTISTWVLTFLNDFKPKLLNKAQQHSDLFVFFKKNWGDNRINFLLQGYAFVFIIIGFFLFFTFPAYQISYKFSNSLKYNQAEQNFTI